MQRKASAHWQGSTKEGSGTLSAQSGTLRDTPYSFKARFGDGKGTNPEELIAAAHAGCYTMALSFTLNNAGITADTIDTDATLTMEDVDGKPTITAVHLVTRGEGARHRRREIHRIRQRARRSAASSRARSRRRSR